MLTEVKEEKKTDVDNDHHRVFFTFLICHWRRFSTNQIRINLATLFGIQKRGTDKVIRLYMELGKRTFSLP